jgi:hypothetical protein
MTIQKPDTLNSNAAKHWAQAAAAIERLQNQGLLKRAILEVVSDGNLYSVDCSVEDDTLAVDGPRKEPGLDTPHEALLRLEFLPTFDSIIPFVDVLSTFQDATVFLPELIISQGKFQTVRDDEDIMVTVVHGAESTDTLAEPSSTYF